nr:uncharacterized protein LOC111413523 [Onthophagus taurus]
MEMHVILVVTIGDDFLTEIPDSRAFTRTFNRLHETGAVPSTSINSHRAGVQTLNEVEQILQPVERSPSTSTRRLSARLGVPHVKVWRTLRTHGLLILSRLQQWNYLHPTTRVTVYRNRGEAFVQFFTKDQGICYCNNVQRLFDELKIDHNPSEWRLFIDSSKNSVKTALLYNGNTLPTIPLAHAVNVKEIYVRISEVSTLIRYNAFEWKVCADLKVIAVVTGLQGGFTKYCCFLCLWDSRAREHHYVRKDWPSKEHYDTGAFNVLNKPLVRPASVILPALHINLGLMKNFVKTLNPEGPAFSLQLSYAKLKEGIFFGPQIRKLINDKEFMSTLTTKEATAWISFNQTVHGFLGNHKDGNYREIISNLLHNYDAINANMSLKIHFLHSHLDFFPSNLGAESDEQGERFHQDLMTLERRYEGYWDAGMMGDYLWSVIREIDPKTYKKLSKNNHIPHYTNNK